MNLLSMTKYELDRTVVKVVPTEDLVPRSRERLGDLSSYVDVGTVVQLHGVLVVDRELRRPCKLYLDFDGIGRFVLAQDGDKFVGVTFIPRTYCHDLETPKAFPAED